MGLRGTGDYNADIPFTTTTKQKMRLYHIASWMVEADCFDEEFIVAVVEHASRYEGTFDLLCELKFCLEQQMFDDYAETMRALKEAVEVELWTIESFKSAIE